MAEFFNPAITTTLAFLLAAILLSLGVDMLWWNRGHSPCQRRWIHIGRTRFGGRYYRDNYGSECVIHWPIDNR